MQFEILKPGRLNLHSFDAPNCSSSTLEQYRHKSIADIMIALQMHRAKVSPININIATKTS